MKCEVWKDNDSNNKYSIAVRIICKLMYALNLKEAIDKSTTHNGID